MGSLRQIHQSSQPGALVGSSRPLSITAVRRRLGPTKKVQSALGAMDFQVSQDFRSNEGIQGILPGTSTPQRASYAPWPFRVKWRDETSRRFLRRGSATSTWPSGSIGSAPGFPLTGGQHRIPLATGIYFYRIRFDRRDLYWPVRHREMRSVFDWARIVMCPRGRGTVCEERPHVEDVRGASGEERIGYTTRPEIRSASYGEPLVGPSMLAQPGIDFDVRQFQPCGNEHFKNWR